LASQLPVKFGVTRPPIRRISMTMRPSAARVGRVGDPGSGVLDMERDIDERERGNERGDFEVAPVPSRYHLARRAQRRL